MRYQPAIRNSREQQNYLELSRTCPWLFTDQQQVVTHKKSQQVLELGIIQVGLWDLVREALHYDPGFPKPMPGHGLVLHTQSLIRANSYYLECLRRKSRREVKAILRIQMKLK